MSGVYIELFHGRKDPNENLDDWGFQGPVLGPFEAVHVTYMHMIRVKYRDVWYLLPTQEDMIHYEDSYYGDWAMFTKLDANFKARKERITKTIKNLNEF